MKVLSIIEPWASLIANGKKSIETRSWKTSYRGELYIHASKKKERVTQHIQELMALMPDIKMEYGNIICKCNLVDCIYMDEKFINKIKENKIEYLCGEYSIGRYAWILDNVEMLDEKFPARGKLNIWNFY